MNRNRYLLGCLLAWTIGTPAQAYVDVSPTIGYLVSDAEFITVLQVEKIHVEKRIVLYKKIADLKGKFPEGKTKHLLASSFHPRETKTVLEWAEPGKTAIAFSSGKFAVVCIGRYWYQCGETSDTWWTMTTGRPELSLAYYGRCDQLREALTDMLAGKEVVIPAINHGAQMGVWQYNTVAYQKVLRGKDCPVWRIKASLKMPDSAWQIGDKDSAWVVGTGAVGLEDIPGLIRTLNDSTIEDRLRGRAAIDLGLVGWQARSALPTLRKAFKDASPLVRVRAARAVGLIAEDYDAPVKALQESLRDPSPAIRRLAAESLGDLGASAVAATSALAEALKDAEVGVRWSAADALARMGPAAKAAVPDLAFALRDKGIRVIAADALGAIGPPASGAIPVLTDAIKDDDEEFRWTSAIALSRIDAKSARVAMPLFIEKLNSPDIRTRWDTLMYIAPMGAEAKEAIPAVLAMVKRGNGWSASTLAAIAGPEATPALRVLFGVLADDWDTSLDIAKIGKAALPGLLEILRDPKEKAKHHLVIKTLGLLSGTCRAGVIPPMIESLQSPDANARKAAAIALASIEPAVTEAATVLSECLKDAEPKVRLAAAIALRVCKESAADRAVATLVELSSHEKTDVRREAVLALGEFGAIAKGAIPALTAVQKDANAAAVRSAAAWAVARINTASANRDAVAGILETLKDPDPRTRRDAARYLGSFGPDARSALEALTAARLDDDETVRRAAVEAIAKIEVKVERTTGGY